MTNAERQTIEARIAALQTQARDLALDEKFAAIAKVRKEINALYAKLSA